MDAEHKISPPSRDPRVLAAREAERVVAADQDKQAAIARLAAAFGPHKANEQMRSWLLQLVFHGQATPAMSYAVSAGLWRRLGRPDWYAFRDASDAEKAKAGQMARAALARKELVGA